VNQETLQLGGEASPIFESIGQGLNAAFFKFSVSGDGSLTFQAARAFISSQLVWFDRNGVQAGVVGQPGYIGEFSISPDGKKVALTRNSSPGQLSGSEIWLHELERGTESRFTFKGYNFNPVWSPDGSSIAYAHSAIDFSTREVYQKQNERDRPGGVAGAGNNCPSFMVPRRPLPHPIVLWNQQRCGFVGDAPRR
jgi:Tol biopolymer transport system component